MNQRLFYSDDEDIVNHEIEADDEECDLHESDLEKQDEVDSGTKTGGESTEETSPEFTGSTNIRRSKSVRHRDQRRRRGMIFYDNDIELELKRMEIERDAIRKNLNEAQIKLTKYENNQTYVFFLLNCTLGQFTCLFFVYCFKLLISNI